MGSNPPPKAHRAFIHTSVYKRNNKGLSVLHTIQVLQISKFEQVTINVNTTIEFQVLLIN